MAEPLLRLTNDDRRQLPRSTVGLPAATEGNVPFWLPSWRERLAYVGWRWLYLAPAVVLGGLLAAAALLKPHLLPALTYIPLKFLLIVFIGLPTTLVGNLLARALRDRPDPFCIHCGYGLSGLPNEHLCPECGRPYDLRLVEEYRRDPKWFRQRWKARQVLPQADVPFASGAAESDPSSDGAS